MLDGIHDETTQFISYCKYDNWMSIRRLIKKEKEHRITFNIQRGFKVACFHRSFAVMKELINNYTLNYLISYGGYFIPYIIKEKDISILEHIIDLGELTFTPDIHGFIQIPYKNERFDIVDILIEKTNIHPLLKGFNNDDVRNYCIKKLRSKKIKKLINGIN